MKACRRHALQRLTHEHVVRKVRNPCRYREKPGKRDEQKHTQSRERKESPQRPASEQRKRHHGGEWNQNRDGALGNRPYPDRRPRQQRPILPERQNGERGTERERAVENRSPRIGEHERHRCEREPREPAGIGTPAPAREANHDHERRNGEEQRRQAGGGFIGPEHLHRHRGGGEIHDRLVEIGKTIEMRQHEVVRLRHLAGDFRVASFVGIEQRIAAEVEAEGEDGGEQQQRQPHVCAERQSARNRAPAATKGGGMKTVTSARAWEASVTP